MPSLVAHTALRHKPYSHSHPSRQERSKAPITEVPPHLASVFSGSTP